VIRLAVRVRREQAELVLAELLELAPGGVEEVEIDAATTEFAVYGAPGELPALPNLQAAAGTALVEIETTTIADDWSERWRVYHKPVRIGERLSIRPPWEPAQGTEFEIVIDPGQAFGTGAHATTRLCLELMLGLPPSGAFVDLGTGSGVLAIAAAKLGWAPVTALDNDRASIEAARANGTANAAEITVNRLDLRTDPVPPAPTVAANLLAPLLCAWARVGVPAATERVIAGGILTREADAVADAFSACGLIESRRRVRGEWSALLLERSWVDARAIAGG
jgi:ribosomal protein L11 methyltransferase